jgi:hypothetical protein
MWNNTRILLTLNLNCVITLREPCNNQRLICDIACGCIKWFGLSVLTATIYTKPNQFHILLLFQHYIVLLLRLYWFVFEQKYVCLLLLTLNLNCVITLREPCNNQRLICDIAWRHAINQLYHGFPELNG